MKTHASAPADLDGDSFTDESAVATMEPTAADRAQGNQSPAPADDAVPLGAVLLRSKTYTFEQVLRLVSGININDLHRRFPGAHVSGGELLEWHRCSATKLMKVRPEFAERIQRAKALVQNSVRPAVATSVEHAERTATSSLPSADAVTSAMGVGGCDLTLCGLIAKSRWYFVDELAEMVDIDANILSKEFGHAPSIIGAEILRYSEIRARHIGAPLTIRASYVAKIAEQDRLQRERRAAAIAEVTSQALALLEKHKTLIETADTMEEWRRQESAIKEKYAKELAEIEAARSQTSIAERAWCMAESIAKELRTLARRHPGLFDRSGALPRLLEPVEALEPIEA
jgi:hypothetical protein